jgi:O-antigen/teichoic acid export membrane protein
MTVFLQVIDAGLTSSISRIIVDVKDRKTTGEYASVLITSWLTQVCAGILVTIIGFAVLPLLPGFLNIPAEYRQDFLILAKCQIGLVGLMFFTRIFDQILSAHQRQYITNYAQIVYFICGYVAMYFGFRHGLGLINMVLANAVAWIGSVIVQSLCCGYLGLLLWRGGRLSAAVFRAVFRLSLDTFLTVFGAQLIMASQTLVVSRTLGVAAAATWAVATRLFFLAGQTVWRLFDSSLPALSEMIVRGEDERLFNRFQLLVRLSGMCGAAAAVFYAAGNSAFLKIWTHGQIAWGRENDILLAVWLVMLSVFHCYGAFIIITKELRAMRYIYFLEGACFVLSGTWAIRRFGMEGMLTASILCSLAFHGNYTYRRIASIFKVPQIAILFTWQKELATLLVTLTAVAVPTVLLTGSMPPAVQLGVLLVVLGGMAIFVERLGVLGSTVRVIVGRIVERRGAI